MKKFGLIYLLSFLLLLTSCQSKKETCARYSINQIDFWEAKKKLGLNDIEQAEIWDYCEYYKR